jgi:hypothetical protein
MANKNHHLNLSENDVKNLIKYRSKTNSRNKRIYEPDYNKAKIIYYKPTQDIFVTRKSESKKNKKRTNIISKVMKEIKQKKTFNSKKRVVALYDGYLIKHGYKGMPYQLKKHFKLI